MRTLAYFFLPGLFILLSHDAFAQTEWEWRNPLRFNAAALPSGIYFCVLLSEGSRQSVKMLLLR